MSRPRVPWPGVGADDGSALIHPLRSSTLDVSDTHPMGRSAASTPEDAVQLFAGHPLASQVFQEVHSVLRATGDCDLRVSRTQVAWARRRGFAVLWLPGRWLSHPTAEVVLSVYLASPEPSPRWKEVTQIRPGLYAHHLEVHGATDIDSQVTSWLREAMQQAGP